jgi:hypothetical protein
MFTPRLFKIKRYSRRVLVFKRSLPVFAFLLASLMLVWPVLIAEQKEQFSVAVKTDKKNKGTPRGALFFYALTILIASIGFSMSPA